MSDVRCLLGPLGVWGHLAGADHVAIIPTAPDGAGEYLPVLEALAPRN